MRTDAHYVHCPMSCFETKKVFGLWTLAVVIVMVQEEKDPSHAVYFDVPSGKLTVCYGKSPFLMGKLTISTGPFSIAFCMFTGG